MTSQLCPRRDDSDRFSGVFSWSTEPLEQRLQLRACSNKKPSSRNSRSMAFWMGSMMPRDAQNSATTSRWHCQTSFCSFLHNLQYTWASDMLCNGSFPHCREMLNLLSSRLYKAKIYEYKLHPVFFLLFFFSFQSNFVERLTYP